MQSPLNTGSADDIDTTAINGCGLPLQNVMQHHVQVIFALYSSVLSIVSLIFMDTEYPDDCLDAQSARVLSLTFKYLWAVLQGKVPYRDLLWPTGMATCRFLATRMRV